MDASRLRPRRGTRAEPMTGSALGQPRTACTSISMRTRLPTRTPPDSSAWFQVSPKSSRSMSVLAEKPTFALPHGSVAAPVNSTARVTGRETPWIARSPWTAQSPSPPGSTDVVRNEIAGNRWTSRKSADTRCPLRPASPVSIEAALISTSTRESSGRSPMTSSALQSVNRPRTFVTTRWRATNSTVEWAVSMVQGPGVGRVRPPTVRVESMVLVMVAPPGAGT